MQHCNTRGLCSLATDVVGYDELRAGTHVPGVYKTLCETDPNADPSTANCAPQKLCENGGGHHHGMDDHHIYHHIRHGDDQQHHHGHEGVPFWGHYPHKNLSRHPQLVTAAPVVLPVEPGNGIGNGLRRLISPGNNTNWPLIFIGIGVLAVLLKGRKK